ncbi:neck protein [Cronobacter phage vB_Cdu_VP8]|nr:neck protein [Cronobacter phage vB_Cdu_VP8]
MAGYVTNNPKELKDAILRRLGAPIICVEVTQDQIYDCIQRALELFGEYHFDGLNRGYMAWWVGDDDLYKNGVLDLKNKGVFAVTKILRTNVGSITSMDGNATYPWFTDFLMGMAGINGGMGSSCSKFYGPNAFGADLGYFTQLMTYWGQMQDMVSPLPDFWFNSATGELKVTGQYHKNDLIVAEVWVKAYIDVPDLEDTVTAWGTVGDCSGHNSHTASQIYMDQRDGLMPNRVGVYDPAPQGAYNNRWVKDMATCLVKELWGGILAKHQGMQLPGGVSPDGTRLIEEARIEYERLRQELDLLDPPTPILVG